jgi:hypothetical protein
LEDLVQKTFRLFGAAIVAALLAACGGSGTASLPQAGSQAPSPALRVPVNSPYIMYGPHGSVAHIMLTREAQARLRAAGRIRSGSSGNLIWNGGPVQNTPSVYIIFWGWTSDPSGEAPYLTNFLSNVGGSSWLNITSQYYDSSGYIANPTGQLAGTFNDSSSAPNKPSQSQVAAEAAKYAKITGKAGPNVSYFVALPTGHDPTGFKTRWCAFHSDTSSSVGEVSYTDFPYQTDAGTSCGENFDGLAPGLLDGVSIVGGHEYAETQTDPQPSTGWTDSSGSEIGDKCAWSSLSTDITLNGSEYAVQPLWDNKISGCATSGP